MKRATVPLLLLLATACLEAQTWAELGTVPRETSVRVFETTVKGSTYADGKLLLVKDNELTILRDSRAYVVPKPAISKVETRRRDSPVEGALIGALTAILLGSRGGWQGCPNSQCVSAGVAVYAGFGTLIDWQILTKRTVYRAP